MGQSASRILWRYIKDHRWQYAAGVSMMLLSIVAQVQIPPVIGAFASAFKDDALHVHGPLHYAARITMWAVLYVIFHWGAMFTIHRLARDFEFHLRNHLFNHWQSLSQNYYSHESVGNLMAYATNDVQAVRSAISMGFNQLTNATFLITTTAIAMAGLVNWQLAVVSLAPLPLVTVAIVVLRPRIRHRFRLLQEGFAALSERTQESINGTRVVKAYVQEQHEIAKFKDAAQHIVDRGYDLTRISGLLSPLIQLVGAVSFLLSLGFGARQVIAGTLEFGDLITFTSYVTLLVNPMRQIGSVIDVWQRASAALNRLTNLFRQRPGVLNVDDPVVLDDTMEGNIEFRNLTFRYPYSKEPSLHNIDLQIKAGTTVAIIGRTASGKTTLANLMLRVFEPPRGQLFIDGHDIRDTDVTSLRRRIAYVPQDVFLFSATIEENIAFGLDDFDADMVSAAAQQAAVYDDVMDLPDQFETELGERGIGLSGGQRQRVAIARGLIKKGTILILDDSLSAVDTKTETAILEQLRRLHGRQTVLLIAHRISTVREADEIIVLHEGRIAERGTHDELMKLRQHYYGIYEMQREGTAQGQTQAAEKTAEKEEEDVYLYPGPGTPAFD